MNDASRKYAAEDHYRRIDSYNKAIALVVKERIDLHDRFARPVFYPATGVVTIELPPEAQEVDDYLKRIMNDAFLRFFPDLERFNDNHD